MFQNKTFQVSWSFLRQKLYVLFAQDLVLKSKILPAKLFFTKYSRPIVLDLANSSYKQNKQGVCLYLKKT